jgi:thioesterase domain-containing protein
VGGNVLEYHELARHLGPDQPFYGLQSLGLDGQQAPLTNIEEMAACYIKEMRQAQPHGPYMIGGRSFGGIVAFEMACRLRAQGQEVNLLALLDTYPVNYFRREPGSNSLDQRAGRYARRMWCHVQNLRQLSLREKFFYAGNKCQYIPAKTRRIVMDRVFGLYKRIARPLPQVLRSIEQLNYSAMRDYVPQVYPGTVTLFLASGDMTASYDLKEGWQALAAGGVEIHEIDGDHINIIKEPFVGQLAAELGACIDEKSVRSDRLEVAA